MHRIYGVRKQSLLFWAHGAFVFLFFFQEHLKFIFLHSRFYKQKFWLIMPNSKASFGFKRGPNCLYWCLGRRKALYANIFPLHVLGLFVHVRFGSCRNFQSEGLRHSKSNIYIYIYIVSEFGHPDSSSEPVQIWKSCLMLKIRSICPDTQFCISKTRITRTANRTSATVAKQCYLFSHAFSMLFICKINVSNNFSLYIEMETNS